MEARNERYQSATVGAIKSPTLITAFDDLKRAEARLTNLCGDAIGIGNNLLGEVPEPEPQSPGSPDKGPMVGSLNAVAAKINYQIDTMESALKRIFSALG